jgi:hypothetical protein
VFDSTNFHSASDSQQWEIARCLKNVSLAYTLQINVTDLAAVLIGSAGCVKSKRIFKSSGI